MNPEASYNPGDRFGALVYVKKLSPDRWNAQRGLFQCDCGALVAIIARRVRSGERQKCAQCAVKDMAVKKRTHGASATSEYRAWRGMHDRCERPTDKDYSQYGGRGIAVCERWGSFVAFSADMGPKPSPRHLINRVDSNGPYSPDNCRWATAKEQAANRRPGPGISAQALLRSVVRQKELWADPAYRNWRCAAMSTGIARARLAHHGQRSNRPEAAPGPCAATEKKESHE